MHEKQVEPQALFLFSEGLLIEDALICSGKLETQFSGACKYSENGQMPGLMTLTFDEPSQESRLGKSGDLAPQCALEHLGDLATWQKNIGERYPHRYSQLRVYKCRQMLMLIVPGIRNDRASIIEDDS